MTNQKERRIILNTIHSSLVFTLVWNKASTALNHFVCTAQNKNNLYIFPHNSVRVCCILGRGGSLILLFWLREGVLHISWVGGSLLLLWLSEDVLQVVAQLLWEVDVIFVFWGCLVTNTGICSYCTLWFSFQGRTMSLVQVLISLELQWRLPVIYSMLICIIS